jgi:hypothetical protein
MTAADALIEMSDVAATARSKVDLFCTGGSLNKRGSKSSISSTDRPISSPPVKGR